MAGRWTDAGVAAGYLIRRALRGGRNAFDALDRVVDERVRSAVRKAFNDAPPSADAGLPATGLSRTEILARLDAYKAFDVSWRDGRTWAYVYDAGAEAEDVCKQGFLRYLSENALDPTAFPSMVQLENEVVGMVAPMVDMPTGGGASLTSGGTESIFMAVKAARDHAREHRPEVKHPRMVLPHTAHASFHKAAHYLGLEVDLVPVDPITFKADPAALREAIGEDTIFMVGSACSYAHAVVDPIGELGRIAQETGIWLHVDACIGGFVLYYFRRLGEDVPPFGFDVPGVSSLSIDLHKYGFAAKGASLVFYRDRALREHQFYACANWSGYTVVNTTMQSTKSGGPVAAAWAVMKFLGDEGYLALFRSMLEATRQVADGIRANPDLRLLGEPETNLVAFTSEAISVFHLADEMRQRGWFIQPQLAFEASKENIHLSVNPKAEQWVERFLADLNESVEAARDLPTGTLTEKVEAELAGLGDSELDRETFGRLLEIAGIDGVQLPDRMAPINEVLNALSPRLREQMLVFFLNGLFTAPVGSGQDQETA